MSFVIFQSPITKHKNSVPFVVHAHDGWPSGSGISVELTWQYTLPPPRSFDCFLGQSIGLKGTNGLRPKKRHSSIFHWPSPEWPAQWGSHWPVTFPREPEAVLNGAGEFTHSLFNSCRAALLGNPAAASLSYTQSSKFHKNRRRDACHAHRKLRR